MLPLSHALVIAHIPLAKAIAADFYKRLFTWYTRDELEAEALYALAQAGARWELYCLELGYSPYRADFFAAYAKRRIKGAILDKQRDDDPLTRSQRAVVKRDATLALPARGSVLVSEEQWNEITASIAAPDSEADSSIIWSSATSAAATTFRSLPYDQQVSVAYVYVKEETYEAPTSVHRLAATAAKHIVLSALSQITPQDAGITIHPTPSSIRFQPSVYEWLHNNHFTFASLLDHFEDLLRTDPSLLVLMAKRSIKHRKEMPGGREAE